MNNLFFYVSWRHLRMKPIRTLLTVFGVAFGVALFVGIHIINQSTNESFKNTVEAISGKAALTVSMGEAGFPESALEKIEKVPGVKSAVPLIEARGFFTRGSGVSESLTILGIDLLRDQAVRTYQQDDGETIADPLLFLNQPDSIILTHTFAQQHGLQEDSDFELSTAHGAKTFTVRGLLSPSGPAVAYGGAIAIMDIDGARYTFGKMGKLDRVDVIATEGQDPKALAEKIRTTLGPGYQVEPISGQIEEMGKMVGSYQILLALFSSLALLVGVFLVANSIGISVAERRKEISSLRALGATKRSILRLFLGEAIFIGATGSIIGVWMGRALASALIGMVLDVLSKQYQLKIDVQKLQFGPRDFALTMAVGTSTALLAAIWPSIQAMRVSPLEALRQSDISKDAQPKALNRLSIIGGGMLAFLTLSSVFEWSKHFQWVEGINQTFAMVGAAFAAPVIVTWAIRASRPWISRFGGAVGMLAERNLLRNPKRTGSNVMSLIVGLIYVVMIATMNQSFKSTIIDWFNVILRADLVVSSYGSLLNNQVQPLFEDIGHEIAQVPGVAGAYAIRSIKFNYEGEQLNLKAFDEPAPSSHYDTFDVRDRDVEAAGRELFHSPDPVVFVSQNFVLHYKKKTGDTIEIISPSGPVKMRIVGVMADWASPIGALNISRDLYKKYWNDPLVTNFAVFGKPGTSPAALRQEIDSRLGRTRNLSVISGADLREQMVKMIDQSFSYTRAIQIAALLVGLLGLMNTLLASVMERTRELGMLRATGMSGKQLRRMILWEAVLQGFFGAVAAAVFGCWISYLWISFSLTHMLGWVVSYRFPSDSVLTAVTAGTLVALLAGLYPAWRAARIEIKEALSYE